jgi:ferritin
MLSPKLVKAINHQINRELYSGYLYLGMSSAATSLGLMGIANWFFVQMQEEMIHARMMYEYVNRQGGRPLLEAIEEPPQKYADPKAMFKKTLEHEREVTKLINNLVSLARTENDHATEIFYQWFVTEQIEEEANPLDILRKLELVGDGNGLFLLDKELGMRVFTLPAQAQTQP